MRACRQISTRVLTLLQSSGFELIGDQGFRVPHIVAAAHPELDSEALMLLLRDSIAISNGAACSSAQYAVSHVYASLGLDVTLAERAVRLSWGHMTTLGDDRLETVGRALSGARIG